uniref:CRAL-TRIO domain-containing protein n=1 Tax=Panagrolaimus sp. ES5 TaxID=591445 RepID=A0AC34GQS5_9BILA
MWSGWILNSQEETWLSEIHSKAASKIEESLKSSTYCSNPFNLLRWAYAYEGDINLATRKFVRSLRIREIIDLDNIECFDETDGIDEAADEYAPLNIFGRISQEDNRVLLLEQSGKFDLQTMMKTIRSTAFMLNRFRSMEKVMKKINEQEQKDRKMSSAVMIIDLEGLSFQSNLISFISGPYRILWGTLIEQYPYLISQIFIVNPPTFMSVLWNACSAFIPTEYRKKIQLLSGDLRNQLSASIPQESLPFVYGGIQQDLQIKSPKPCIIQIPKAELSLDEMLLDEVIIPAGGFVVHTFKLEEDEKIDFFMKHDQEFTMNIFYHKDKKRITKLETDLEEMEER